MQSLKHLTGDISLEPQNGNKSTGPGVCTHAPRLRRKLAICSSSLIWPLNSLLGHHTAEKLCIKGCKCRLPLSRHASAIPKPAHHELLIEGCKCRLLLVFGAELAAAHWQGGCDKGGTLTAAEGLHKS
eukprot:scaffold199423_cov15-Tisochrysis_lutea.AAC.1